MFEVGRLARESSPVLRIGHALPPPEIRGVGCERISALDLGGHVLAAYYISRSTGCGCIFQHISRSALAHIRAYGQAQINEIRADKAQARLKGSGARFTGKLEVRSRKRCRCAHRLTNYGGGGLHGIRMALRAGINGTYPFRINLCALQGISCRFHGECHRILIQIGHGFLEDL